MILYPIFYAPNENWTVAASLDSGGFSPDLAFILSATLGGVCLAFGDIFGKDALSKYPRLTVLNSSETPQCFSGAQLIFLSTEGNYPQQHIYQFAHELCHFVIHKPVCSAYRWLSETLCEVMSWCALSWVYEHREDAPLWPCRGIYASFPDYIANSRQDRLELDGQPLRQFVAQNLSHLRVDCYDRRMNRAIANELFPLFRDHPELWQAALQLPQLTDEMPLDAALHLICDTAEVSSDLRDTLVGLLVGRQ